MTDIVTITGNVGSDPQHQISAGGVSITRFSVATTHRWKNRESGEWEDKDTNWYSVSAFRQLADHAHASIKKGDPVIVTGRMIQRSWEANGRPGTSTDIEADVVGLDLRWGTGSIQRRKRAAGDESVHEMSEVDAGAEPAVEDVQAAPVAEEEPVPF